MPFNGAGSYSPPATDFPAVPTTLIESAHFNNVVNDIATALSSCITKDGQTTVTGNIPFAGFRLTGVGAGVARTDAANVGQLQDNTATWCGTVAGTADAITLTPSPAIAAYAAGQSFIYKSGAAANTGAMTVAVSGLAAKAIQNNGAAMAAGEHAISKWYRITYDGAAFQLEQIQPSLAQSLGVAKGDLISFGAAAVAAILSVGTNGFNLFADSTQATGLKWAAPDSAAGVDVASGATCNIGAAGSRLVRITGSTDITAFDNVAAGIWRICRMELTGLQITYNAASMILPLPFNIQVMTGDSFLAESLGAGNWKIHFYQRADGQRLLGGRIPFTVFHRGILNAAASSTMYAEPIGETSTGTELDAEIIIPDACTISELRLLSSAALAGGTAVATLRKSRVDTAVTCTLAAASGTSASDLTHSVDYAEGDTLSIKLVTGAIGGTTDFGFSVVIKKKSLSVGVPMQFHYHPYTRQVSGNNVCHFGAGVTIANHEYPVPPCRVGSRAPYFSVGGTFTNFQSWNILRNGALPNSAISPNDALVYPMDASSGRVANPGVRGAAVIFAEGDLYTLYGNYSSIDTTYLRGVMDAFGLSDQQYPHSLLIYKCNNQGQATTRYAGGYIGESEGTFQSATETDVQVPMSACTLRGLRVALGAAPAAGQTYIITVRKNGVDTALTCTVTSAGRTGSDLTNSAAFAAGDILTVKVVASATSGNRSVNLTIEVNP